MSIIQLPAFPDPTINVGVEATQVLAIEPVPGGVGLRISVERGTSEQTTEPFVFVTGTLAAIGLLLTAGGATLTQLTDTSGNAVAVNPGKVAAIEVASPTTCRVSVARSASRNTDGPFLTIAGTALATATALNATAGGPTGLVYTPVLASTGAGVVAPSGTWRAIRVGRIVFVSGALDFTPAVAGVAETLSATLPPGLPADPTPFGAATDAAGVISSPPRATDFATSIVATVAAATVQAAVTSNAVAPDTLGVWFSYAQV